MQMDGPLGLQSYIPKRGDRGQGSKPQLTLHPALCLGDVLGSRMKHSSGWLHYAVCAINAATRRAGVYWSGVLFVSLTLYFVYLVPKYCSLQNVAVQLA